MSDPVNSEFSDHESAPEPETDAAQEEPRAPILSAMEIRVLGSLMEKEATTPDYYPMTLNSLTNACNQKSNRDPVMSLADKEVENALDTLRYHHQLVTRVHTAGSRAHKYRHTILNRFKLSPEQSAVLCELLLRGPETVGELRGRAARLFPFDNLDAVEKILEQLQDFPGQALVVQLPREPGRRESRFMHLLGGPPVVETPEQETMAADRPVQPTRLDLLEAEVKALRQDFNRMQQAFEELGGRI